MTTQTLYHVTDESNVESIQNGGLVPHPSRGHHDNFVFLTTSEEEAEYIGEIYNTVDDPAVFEVEVMEHKLQEDPDPHGDLDSYAHRGEIPTHDVELV